LDTSHVDEIACHERVAEFSGGAVAGIHHHWRPRHTVSEQAIDLFE